MNIYESDDKLTNTVILDFDDTSAIIDDLMHLPHISKFFFYSMNLRNECLDIRLLEAINEIIDRDHSEVDMIIRSTDTNSNILKHLINIVHL